MVINVREEPCLFTIASPLPYIMPGTYWALDNYREPKSQETFQNVMLVMLSNNMLNRFCVGLQTPFGWSASKFGTMGIIVHLKNNIIHTLFSSCFQGLGIRYSVLIVFFSRLTVGFIALNVEVFRLKGAGG